MSNDDPLNDLKAEIDGPGRVYFDNPVMDHMLDALLEMSATLWTLRDRQIVLEKVLAEKGIEVSELIEQHIPDESEIAERRAERDEFSDRIFASFLSGSEKQ